MAIGKAGGDVGVGIGAGLAGLILEIPVSYLVFALARMLTGHKATQPKQIVFSGHPGWPILALIGFGVIVLAPIAE